MVAIYGPPRVGTNKKSRKIFFIWPQSTKKVTHAPVFEEKKLFLRKKNEKKNLRPTGGVWSPRGGLQGGSVVPQGGGLQGGCRARKKKFPKKIQK